MQIVKNSYKNVKITTKFIIFAATRHVWQDDRCGKSLYIYIYIFFNIKSNSKSCVNSWNLNLTDRVICP